MFVGTPCSITDCSVLALEYIELIHLEVLMSVEIFLKHYYLSTGLLSLVYALLHNSGTARVSVSPLPLSDVTISILTAVFRLINVVALVDIGVLQVRPAIYSVVDQPCNSYLQAIAVQACIAMLLLLLLSWQSLLAPRMCFSCLWEFYLHA